MTFIIIHDTMHTYHVYFTPQEGVTDAELKRILSTFVQEEMDHNRMAGYGITKFENKASFPDLSDYHFTAHYASKEDQETAMKDMAKRYKQEPHASLMKIVADFRVAFSEELEL